MRVVLFLLTTSIAIAAIVGVEPARPAPARAAVTQTATATASCPAGPCR